MEKQKTAVEWFQEELKEFGIGGEIIYQIFQQALEIEKEREKYLDKYAESLYKFHDSLIERHAEEEPMKKRIQSYLDRFENKIKAAYDAGRLNTHDSSEQYYSETYKPSTNDNI